MSQSSSSFDLIEAVGRGYQFFWAQRMSILKIAVFPLLIGLACYAVLTLLELPETDLRQFIIMLPSYFAEGWMVVFLVRAVFIDGDYKPHAKGFLRADRNMQAGILLYALTKYILFGGVAVLLHYFGDVLEMLNEQATPDPDTSLKISIGIIAGAVVSISLFRFLWLYIPVAVGISLRRYVRAAAKSSTALQMFGIWLLCFFPFAITFLMLGSVILSPFQDQDDLPLTIEIIVITIQMIFKIMINVATTVCMAYGIKSLMSDDSQLKS